MKKENKDFENLEEFEEVSDTEQEEIDSYMDKEIEDYLKGKGKSGHKLRKTDENVVEEDVEDIDLEEYEIEDDFTEQKEDEEYIATRKKNRLKKISNIIFIILFVIILLAIIDIICVSKFEKGPFFAIPVHTYDDGGTKEYYGLGYKVIKYNQVQGRRDLDIGTWGLTYNVDPIYINLLDLAIEFNDDEATSYAKYYKQLLIVTGTLRDIDTSNNRIVLAYEDEGEKYSLDVVCDMETDKDSLNTLESNYEISAMGTMTGYSAKTDNSVTTIYLDNCFAEQ